MQDRIGPDLLDPALLDRATGMMITAACGDALGVPYEFAIPPRYGEEAVMRGGGLGPYAPGEWSDDTQMAVCVAGVAARYDMDPSRPAGRVALDEVASSFEAWAVDGATDIGRQTAAVLRNAVRLEGRPADRLRRASLALQPAPSLTAGNGSLMRAGVIGISILDGRWGTARAARANSELTHADPVAGDACMLWAEAVRLAVTEARLNVAAGLDLIPRQREVDWIGWVQDAERPHPGTGLRANGFAVTALQAALHAITVTALEPGAGPVDHLTTALQAAIRIGGDTDTVAAITGALLGARYGTAAIPRNWLLAVHGWPGLRARGLGALARAVVQRPLVGSAAGVESCPVCGTMRRPSTDLPSTVCRWCREFVTDEEGRPVRLLNTSREGGYTARYDDGAPASKPVLDGHVWIDGRELRVGDARPGDIVVHAA